jgi:hypothetical protein
MSPTPTEGLTLICAEAGEAKTATRAMAANTKATLVFRVDSIKNLLLLEVSLLTSGNYSLIP